MIYKCNHCGETFPYEPVYCNNCGARFSLTTFTIVKDITKKKLCPNCKEEWDGIECNNCGMDTGFDPNWD